MSAGPLQQPSTSAWSIYRAIVGIGAVCAVLIVLAYQTTAGRIRDNKAQFLALAIAEILPQAQSTVAVEPTADGRLRRIDEAPALPVFLGYGADGTLVGAVVAAEGMGYQDTIRLLYAYSFEVDAIVGFKVLDSTETPGLGDKISKDPHFLANFARLDARLGPEGNALLHRIINVKHGEKTEPWQIDGITGATISSEAVARILNASANTWVPVLEKNAPVFAVEKTVEEP